MFLMLKYALLSATVLMLVALGGCFSEHSGVINLALEGIMVIGGLVGTMALNLLPADMLPVWKVVISICLAAVSGIAYSSLLAFSAINLKADQTIGGTALNLLSTAIALVVVKRYNGTQSAKLSYDNSPFIFQVGPLTLNVFLIIGLVLLAVSIVLLYKTRFGLRLQACGEHPQAAGSVGINVYKMRWAGVLISGFLAGIGGFAYIVPAVQTWNFEVGVAGMGFLALAVMIFGQWKPQRIALAALLFGLARKPPHKGFLDGCQIDTLRADLHVKLRAGAQPVVFDQIGDGLIDRGGEFPVPEFAFQLLASQAAAAGFVLAQHRPDFGAGLGSDRKAEPIRLGGLVFLGEDFDNVAVVQHLADRNRAVIDFPARAGGSQVGVDVERKVEHRGPLGQLAQVAVGREDEDFARGRLRVETLDRKSVV